MGKTPWVTYLWPGLPLVWKRVDWSALGLALGFSVVVNFAILASMVWTELVPTGVRDGAWLVVLALWFGMAVAAWRRDGKGLPIAEAAERENSFSKALEHYLRGNWFEAECVLTGLLRRDPRDVDAGLMLATLYRHSGRRDEAVQELDRLERIDEAAKWALEIARERQWLALAAHAPSPQPLATTNGE
jgi:tetratricopeptide (TPR) repeat protein